MTPEHRPEGKVTLEDLLRLKRAERPPADFWTEFERELRTRQLAAAVEKRRWWFSLPRVFTGLARYQMPMGAAAVFAVTFLTLREYHEPGFESQFVAPATAELPATAVDAADGEATEHVVEFDVVEVAPRPAERTQPVAAERVASDEALSPMLPWASDLAPERGQRELSPSQRSIAANLAAADPELTRMLGGTASLRLNESNQREPLAQLTSPREQRRQRLFAYDPQLATYASAGDGVAPERVASRLNESELYETVRRLSGGGDRLTVKF